MKKLMTFHLGVLLLLAAGLLQAAFPASSPAIILPVNPTATERFSAEELSKYLGKILNRPVPIRQEVQTGDYPIRLNKCRSTALTEGYSKSVAHIEHDAFTIRCTSFETVLEGNSERGTLYAAYEFLEKIGCRWFFPGELGECIPSLQTLELEEGTEKHVPSFNQRTIDVGNTDKMDFGEIIDWAAKNRLNFIPASQMAFVRRFLPREQQDIWEKRGGQQAWQFHVHNLTQMVPPEKYFSTHPEYFALYKGTRHPSGTPGKPSFGGGNICTTNPDVINLCSQFAMNYFSRTPEGMVVPLWPADGSVIWCECPECKKLKGVNFMGGRRGSMTRRMLTFGNEVARRVARDYPDRLILVPAYANYIRPIPDFKLEPNVYIQYCIHGDYAHGVDRCDQNLEERTRLESWAAIVQGGPLGVWEYFLLGDHYAAPVENSAMLPCLYRVRDTLPYFHKIGVNNYMTQASTKYWKHNMLLYYLTARYAWNVQRDFNALLDDYARKMFGPAGTCLRDYYLLIENAVAAADWHPTVYSDLAVPSAKVFTPALMKKAKELLEQAGRHSLSKLEKRRLELVQETFQNIANSVGIQSSLGLDAKVQWSIQRGSDCYIMNPQGRELTRDDEERLVLNAQDAGTYDEEFRRILFRARKRSIPVTTLQNSSISMAVIPELGGRLIRLTDRKTGRNLLWEPEESSSSIGVKYFNYGGYEEFIGKGFASPGWEAAYRILESTPDSITLACEVSGLAVTRTFRLLDNGLSIHTTVKNPGQEQTVTLLRTHPFFRSPVPVDGVTVQIRKADGTARQSTISMEHDHSSAGFSGGQCQIQLPGTPFCYQVSSSADGNLYFCKIQESVFTMEWLGNETTLPPGESLTLQQIFTITHTQE